MKKVAFLARCRMPGEEGGKGHKVLDVHGNEFEESGEGLEEVMYRTRLTILTEGRC